MAASDKAAWAQLPAIAEVLKHPAFPTALWNLIPTKKGYLPVAEGRGGPFKISWEVHGDGPIRLVLLMGLGSFKNAWQRQTLHFGHEHADRYSVLVLDNRGMGDSDVPLMRYSTSEMARDTLEVLEHVGWVDSPASPAPAAAPARPRTLHVVGISMGGMVAQELAALAPSQVSSLSLVCTAAAVENTVGFWENMMNRASLLVPKSVEASVRGAARNLFPLPYLAAPDDAHLPVPSATPGVASPGPDGEPTRGLEYRRFETNYQRFVAQEMHKRLDARRFTTKGFLLQLIAAGWHHKSRAQLEDMADKVGRERIFVIHGTEDGMISVPHGRKLIEYIKPGVGIIKEGMGHAPPVEHAVWFNELIEERVANGEKLDGR